MKRYTTLILAGLVLLLAAVLSGVLIFMKNQPPQQRATLPQIAGIKPMEPNSALWGENFPNQWSTFQQTKDNNIRTTYGGSEKFSHLTEDPRQVILFAGLSVQQRLQRRTRPYEQPDRRACHQAACPNARRSKGDPRHLLFLQVLR